MAWLHEGRPACKIPVKLIPSGYSATSRWGGVMTINLLLFV